MATKKNTMVTAKGKEYNYFRITKVVGHEIIDGKKVAIKKQFVGTSKKDAENKYFKYIEEKYKDPIVDSGKSFSELADFYVKNVLRVNAKYSIGTRELYSAAYYGHLRDTELKNRAIINIKAADIQKLYNDLDVSYSSIRCIHKFMKGFYSWAEYNGYCNNPLEGVILPEKVKIKKQEDIITWTDEELDIIKESEPDYVLKPMILFAIYSGMRISEILGLQWSDISNGIIHVRRQYYRGSWTPPKGNKEREIPLHSALVNIIPDMDHNLDLIFHTASGAPLDYKNVNRSLDRFYARIGVKHKKFHAYRATFCTTLCKNGVPIQITSKLAGHESIEVTAKYYTSVKLDEMSDALMKL